MKPRHKRLALIGGNEAFSLLESGIARARMEHANRVFSCS